MEKTKVYIVKGECSPESTKKAIEKLQSMNEYDVEIITPEQSVNMTIHENSPFFFIGVAHHKIDFENIPKNAVIIQEGNPSINCESLQRKELQMEITRLEIPERDYFL